MTIDITPAMAPSVDATPPSDAEYALALGGLPASEAPAAEAPKTVRWLTNRKRTESYALLDAFEYGGKEYRTVTIRRMTFDEITSFMDRMRQEDGAFRFPLYYDERGELISDEVWSIIEADDKIELTRIGSDFLPAIFRPTTERTDLTSPLPSGGTTANSSVT